MAQRAASSTMARRVSAWTMPARGVLPPLLILADVRAIAPVAGKPPKIGQTRFRDALGYEFRIAVMAVSREAVGDDGGEQRFDRAQQGDGGWPGRSAIRIICQSGIGSTKGKAGGNGLRSELARRSLPRREPLTHPTDDEGGGLQHRHDGTGNATDAEPRPQQDDGDARGGKTEGSRGSGRRDALRATAVSRRTRAAFRSQR